VPAATLTFAWGEAAVEFTREGTLAAVRHPAGRGRSYLAGLTLPTLTVAGQRLASPVAVVEADRDELHLTGSAGPVGLTLRHAVGAGWGIRLVLRNRAEGPVRVTAEVPLAAGPGCRGWGWAAGAEAGYSSQPADGTGPVLGGSLRLGAVRAVTEHGLLLDEIELAPSGRYVVQWQWDWYPTPRAYGEARPRDLPRATTVQVGEPVTVLAGEDVVVLPPAEVELSREGEAYELVSATPGTHPLELRSARGQTRVEVTWVAPAEDLLAEAASRLLARPPTRAGVVSLRGVAEGLVVQHALTAGRVDPERAEEALDLATARLDARPAGALEVAFLCGEFDRTGDADLLAAARTDVLATSSPAPGLGIALLRLSLALTVSNRSPSDVLAHAERIVSVLPPPAERPLTEQAAALELIAVTRAGPGARGAVGPGGAGRPAEVAERTAPLGAALGGGLPGHALPPLELELHSQVIATLSLLPETSDATEIRRWGCSAPALAERALPDLLARLASALGRDEVGPALAWLALVATR